MVHSSFWFMVMMLIYWEDTVQENAEALEVVSMETGQDVNADKSKYMVMSQDQNAG